MADADVDQLSVSKVLRKFAGTNQYKKRDKMLQEVFSDLPPRLQEDGLRNFLQHGMGVQRIFKELLDWYLRRDGANVLMLLDKLCKRVPECNVRGRCQQRGRAKMCLHLMLALEKRDLRGMIHHRTNCDQLISHWLCSFPYNTKALRVLNRILDHPSYWRGRDIFCRGPLFYAARYGDLQMFMYLLKVVPPAAVDDVEQTDDKHNLLSVALTNSRPCVYKFLAQHLCDFFMDRRDMWTSEASIRVMVRSLKEFEYPTRSVLHRLGMLLQVVPGREQMVVDAIFTPTPYNNFDMDAVLEWVHDNCPDARYNMRHVNVLAEEYALSNCEAPRYFWGIGVMRDRWSDDSTFDVWDMVESARLWATNSMWSEIAAFYAPGQRIPESRVKVLVENMCYPQCYVSVDDIVANLLSLNHWSSVPIKDLRFEQGSAYDLCRRWVNLDMAERLVRLCGVVPTVPVEPDDTKADDVDDCFNDDRFNAQRVALGVLLETREERFNVDDSLMHSPPAKGMPNGGESYRRARTSFQNADAKRQTTPKPVAHVTPVGLAKLFKMGTVDVSLKADGKPVVLSLEHLGVPDDLRTRLDLDPCTSFFAEQVNVAGQVMYLVHGICGNDDPWLNQTLAIEQIHRHMASSLTTHWSPKPIAAIIHRGVSAKDVYLDDVSYPVDGYIIAPRRAMMCDTRFYKYKPRHHLSLDLRHDGGGSWCSREGTVVHPTARGDCGPIGPGEVYRFRWLKGAWVPCERRLDKKYGNPYHLCRQLTLDHLYPWSSVHLPTDPPWYDYPPRDGAQDARLRDLPGYVLNLGCGYRKYANGVNTDLDLALLGPNDVWMDLRVKWTMEEQEAALTCTTGRLGTASCGPSTTASVAARTPGATSRSTATLTDEQGEPATRLWHRMNLLELAPLRGPFDHVVMDMCLSHIHGDHWVQEVHNRTAPGATLHLTFLDADTLPNRTCVRHRGGWFQRNDDTVTVLELATHCVPHREAAVHATTLRRLLATAWDVTDDILGVDVVSDEVRHHYREMCLVRR